MKRCATLVWLLLVVACGGGAPAIEEPAPPVVVEPTGPGRLEGASSLGRVAVADIDAAVAAAGSRMPALEAIYDVDNHRL